MSLIKRAETTTTNISTVTTATDTKLSTIKSGSLVISFEFPGIKDDKIKEKVANIITDKSIQNDDKVKQLKTYFPALSDKQISELMNNYKATLSLETQSSEESELEEVYNFPQITSATNEAKTETDIIAEKSKKESLLSLDKVFNEKFENKTAEEKLNEYIKAYLEKTDPKYATMNKTQKKVAQSKYKENILTAINPNAKNKVFTKVDCQKAILLINNLYLSDTTLTDYSKLSTDQQKEFNTKELKTSGAATINQYINELGKGNSIIENLHKGLDKDGKKIDNPAKIAADLTDAYIDAACEKIDPKYKTMNPEEKAAFQEKYYKLIASKIGFTEENTNVTSLKNKINTTIGVAKDNNISVGEYLTKGFSERFMLDCAYNKNQGQISDGDKILNNLIGDYMDKNNGRYPTLQYLENQLNKLKSTGNFPENQINEAERKIGIGKIFDPDSKHTVEPKEPMTREFANNRLSEIADLKNGGKESKRIAQQKAEELFGKCNSVEDVSYISEELKKIGFNDKEIKKLVAKNPNFTLLIDVIDKKRGDVAAEMYDNTDNKNLQTGLANAGTKYIIGKAGYPLVDSVNRSDNKDAKVVAASNLNTYWTTKDVDEYTYHMVSTNSVSPAGQAEFANNLLRTTTDTTRQEHYVQEYTKYNNAAIDEGLAAGTSAIKDQSVRDRCTETIKTAVANSNFSAEEKSRISTALETGKISEVTLSKTTVEASQNSTQATEQKTEQPKVQTSSQEAVQAQTQAYTQTATQTVTDRQPQVTTQVSTPSVTRTSTPVDSQMVTPSRNNYSAQPTESISSTNNDVTEKLNDKKEAVLAQATTETPSINKKEEVDKIFGNNTEKTNSTDIKSQLNEIVTAENVSEIYHYIATTYPGKEDELVEAITVAGRMDVISSLITSDETILIKIFNVAGANIQTRLANKFNSKIFALIKSNQIKFEELDTSIQCNFIKENISSMTAEEFSNYIKSISNIGAVSLLIDLWNQIHPNNRASNNTSNGEIVFANNLNKTQRQEKATQPTQPTAAQPIAEQEETTLSGAQSEVAQIEKSGTAIGNGMILGNDGKVRKQKETFGAVSSNDYTAYEEVDMAEVPMSDAWLEKYASNPSSHSGYSSALYAFNGDSDGARGSNKTNKVSDRIKTRGFYIQG